MFCIKSIIVPELQGEPEDIAKEKAKYALKTVTSFRNSPNEYRYPPHSSLKTPVCASILLRDFQDHICRNKDVEKDDA